MLHTQPANLSKVLGRQLKQNTIVFLQEDPAIVTNDT